MKLNIRQDCFNTTLMSVAKGALDYYGIRASVPMAYGGSGHAFLINIHEEICPSGPYFWNQEGFNRLLPNLGLELIDLGGFGPNSSADERTAAEQKVRQFLDEGLPCALCNMENQLICGYDETEFLLTQPWKGFTDITPATLTFGSWNELGTEIHICFYAFKKTQPAERDTAVRAALEYAIDLFRSPTRYAVPRYGIGPDAYDNWLKAIDAGHGASHGNWWNATVWAECRKMASAFFSEVAGAEVLPEATANELRVAYQKIGAKLELASNKEMAKHEKLALVRELKELELSAIEQISALDILK